MGLCVCARILNHNMVKYTLQLCRKEMTVVMEFLVENFILNLKIGRPSVESISQMLNYT